MNCIVCDDDPRANCEFCGTRLKVLAHVNEERDATNLTVFDQEHAGAIGKLRGAHTFVLAYVGDDGIGSVVGNCREGIWLTAACALAEQAVAAVRSEDDDEVAA